MGERRGTLRQKSFLRGRVYFNNRRSVADCLVRDFSDHGARLIFSTTVAIPDVADLYVPQKEQTLRIQVQWRHGDEIGVAFVAAGQAVETAIPAETSDLSERVQRLETEIAALRRMLKRLQAAVPGVETDAA